MTVFAKNNGEWAEAENVWTKKDGQWSKLPRFLPFGIVYYKDTPSSDEVKSVEINSFDEFNSLCSPSGSDLDTMWTAEIGEITVSNNDDNCIVGIEIGSLIKSIPSRFLDNCHFLYMPVTIPDNVTSINNYFMSRCISFDNTVTISDSVTRVGSYFMYWCLSFSQPFVFPRGVENQSTYGNFTYFMNNCPSLTVVDVGNMSPNKILANSTVQNRIFTNTETVCPDSSCNVCSRGIYIKGNNRAAWISKLKDISSTSGCRKILDYGS